MPQQLDHGQHLRHTGGGRKHDTNYYVNHSSFCGCNEITSISNTSCSEAGEKAAPSLMSFLSRLFVNQLLGVQRERA